MPNGNHGFKEKELPMLEKFFSQFANELESFAEKHNLLIDKYWHQFHSWRFSFRHPKDGVAAIEVFKESDSSIKIFSYWWIDDYVKFTRSSYKDETKEIETINLSLIQILEEKLEELLALEKKDLSEITKGFDEVWNRYTKKEFEKFKEKYPILK